MHGFAVSPAGKFKQGRAGMASISLKAFVLAERNNCKSLLCLYEEVLSRQKKKAGLCAGEWVVGIQCLGRACLTFIQPCCVVMSFFF